MNVSDFLRFHQVRAPKMMWLLGAGASAAAGVPTAYHLIWRFKQMLYCSEQHVSVRTCSDLGDPTLRSRIQHYFDSKGGFPKENSDDEYAHYFEAMFPYEADRQRYLEEIMRGVSPSYGHFALAALMKLAQARLIWTTNFDSMIEDAAATMYGSSGRLIVATPDAPHLGTHGIADERYPILVKLHGDFRSRRLKNTSEELRAQDAELRRDLVDTCKRFGLAVVGYSGRDESVMDALREVAESGHCFPFGLFWFYRPDSPCLQKVRDLIEQVCQAGADAEMIELDTFDELMGDLLLLIQDVPEDVQKHLSTQRQWVSNVPLPPTKGKWPVLRLNALPILDAPTVCRRIVCSIGGIREVREALREANTEAIATRRQLGVIAFGSDAEIKHVFGSYGITTFDLHTIEPKRLRYESAEHGLLYEAIGRALQRERPVSVYHRRQGHLVVVNPSRGDRFQALKQVTRDVEGVVPGTQLSWAEAIRIRLEYRLDMLWLLMEPTIWVETTHEDAAFERGRQFVQQRLAARYNSGWNEILDAWANIIAGGERESIIRAFGIGDGCDAVFKVSGVTAFSRREVV